MFTALPKLDDAFKKGGWIIHPAWRIAIQARFLRAFAFRNWIQALSKAY
jgi:hypothetical protein